MSKFLVSLEHHDESLSTSSHHQPHHRTEIELRPKEKALLLRATAWAGAMPTYRPSPSTYSWLRFFKLLVLSMEPLCIAFAASMAVLKTLPVYFSCRPILILSIFLLWVLSLFLGWFLSWLLSATGQTLFYILVTKDMVIAITNLLLINLTSSGWGNTCDCWGRVTHSVQLNPVSVFNRNNNMLYPSPVGGCFALQILFFAPALLPHWREYRMMWRKGAREDSEV